jgi:UDP-N-acetylglucosamine 1-carboxyvinyltransferase
LKSLPRLSDISLFCELLGQLGCKVTQGADGALSIDSAVIDNPVGEYEIVRRMRASICILGPLLARFGRAEVSMPGGCAIGDRPIDIHLRGLRELGARVHLENGYIVAEAPQGLTGKEIFLGGPFGSTVLGTANVLMAATLAKGRTVIESAACEPEIADLARCLSKMGAKIGGIGSPRLTVEGVERLAPVDYEVIADRIEAGTFMVAAAITGGEVRVRNCQLDDMMAVVDKLRSIGVTVEAAEGGCIVARNGAINTADITTQPYPGFPTDLQAQFMALLALAEGNSVIVEKVFPDRFMHVAELNRMAANLRKEGPAVICGGEETDSGAGDGIGPAGVGGAGSGGAGGGGDYCCPQGLSHRPGLREDRRKTESARRENRPGKHLVTLCGGCGLRMGTGQGENAKKDTG